MTSQRPRVEEAGAIYHVCARGAVGQDIFRDGTDRQRYLQFLARTVRWATWHCLSYCLMGNHIHLLLETPKPNLADGMMRFHGRYATAPVSPMTRRASRVEQVPSFGVRVVGDLFALAA